MRRIAFLTCLWLLPWTPAATQTHNSSFGGNRPAAAVASTEALVLEGVPNFHKVDTNFYRSGQPDISGFRGLISRYHIRTVISLRTVARDDLLLLGADFNVRLLQFRIHPIAVGQERATVVAALHALRFALREGPTLVHCEHGSDRTGMIVALYRILYQGWSKQDALREMRDRAFGFHAIWGNIPRFIEDVDVAQLKQQIETRAKRTRD